MDATDQPTHRSTISVSGLGRASRPPDQARLSFSVEVTTSGAGDAQRGASEGMRAVLTALAESVDAGDLATQAIALEPVYDYRESGARLTGYRATQTVAVRVRRLDELGALIDRAVGAGATGITGVELGLADPAAAESEARAMAVADARTRAQGLADAAGATLGEVLALEEGPVTSPPRPMMRMAAEQMTGGTPLAEGTTEVVVEVRATFAMGA